MSKSHFTLPTEFPLPPKVEWAGPRLGVFQAPFAFESPSLGRIVIPVGFDTDYASVPRLLWNLYPPDGPWSPAAWIHDLLYWYHGVPALDPVTKNPLLNENDEPLVVRPITRAQADNVLVEGMKALGIGSVTRFNFHTAVRLGGGSPWNEAERQRLNLPNVSKTNKVKHGHPAGK